MSWTRIVLLLLLLSPVLARAQTAPISNFCVNGAKPAITSGLPSSNQNQNLIPNCTVRVFMAGTITPATIYADNKPTPTPLPNPFTANTDASWTFYVPIPATPGQAQGYDVVLSGGIAPNTYSLPRTLVNLSLGGGFVSGGSGPCPNCVITNPTSSQTVVQPTGSALEVDAGVSNPNPLPNNGTVFKVEDIAPNQNGIDMWSGRVAQIIMNTPDLFNGTDALEMFGGTDGNSQLLLGVSITSGGNVAPHSHNELDGNANDFSGLTYLDPCVNSPGTTNCDGQFNTVFDLSASGAAGGNLNLTLPPVYANFGFAYNPTQGNIVADDLLVVRKTDASASTVTVVPAAGDVIAGGNPVLTAQWQSVMLMGWSPYTGSATHTWTCIAGCATASGTPFTVSNLITPPIGGQYVFVPATSHSTSGDSGNCLSAITNTSGGITVLAGNFPPCILTANWTGYTLPSYVNPANVTSVYGVMYGGGSAAFISAACASGANFGGNTYQQYTALLSGINGSNLNTVTCSVEAGGSGPRPQLQYTVSNIGLLVYYTGTPPPAGNNLLVQNPLIVDPATGALGVYQGFPFKLNAVPISNLPAANTAPSTIYLISDGTSASDCSVGGGSFSVLCTNNNGGAWGAYGGAGGSVSVNGSPVTNPNFNNTTPAAGANFQNVQLQVSGSNISAEIPYADASTFGLLKCGSGVTCASGVISVSASSGIPAWSLDDFTSSTNAGALGWLVTSTGTGTGVAPTPPSTVGATAANANGLMDLTAGTSANGWESYTLCCKTTANITWLQASSGALSVASSLEAVSTANGPIGFGITVNGASFGTSFTGFTCSVFDNAGSANWYYQINGATPVATSTPCTSFHTLEVAASGLSVTLYIDGTSVATGTVTTNIYVPIFNAQNKAGGTPAAEMVMDWFAIKNPVIANLR